MSEVRKPSQEHQAWNGETWLLAKEMGKQFGRDDVNKRISYILNAGVPEDARLAAVLEASRYAPAGEDGLQALCDLMEYCGHDAARFDRFFEGIVREAKHMKPQVPATVLPDMPYIRDLRARVDEVIGHLQENAQN